MFSIGQLDGPYNTEQLSPVTNEAVNDTTNEPANDINESANDINESTRQDDHLKPTPAPRLIIVHSKPNDDEHNISWERDEQNISSECDEQNISSEHAEQNVSSEHFKSEGEFLSLASPPQELVSEEASSYVDKRYDTDKVHMVLRLPEIDDFEHSEEELSQYDISITLSGGEL